MCTLAAPGCQRVCKMHSGSPRLSESNYDTLWQPQAVKRGKISPLIAPSYQRVNKMHSDSLFCHKGIECTVTVGDRRVKANFSYKSFIVERSKIQVYKNLKLNVYI